MKRTETSVKKMILAGMFAAVLAILSQIQIPMPSGVPVTLQTFAVALTGFVLGMQQGTMAVFVYVLVGAVGLPVFTGLKGGAAAIAGPTGGFILGFLILAALCGYACQRCGKIRLVLATAGILMFHLIGCIHFMMIMQVDFLQALITVSVPYLAKDILSVILAHAAARGLKRRLIRSGIDL